MPFHHLYRPIAFITLYFSKSLSYSLSYPLHRRCRSHNCLHSCLIRAKRLHLSAYGRAKFSVPHNPSPRKRLLPPATGWPPGISDTSVRKSPECHKLQPQGYCGFPPRNHLRYSNLAIAVDGREQPEAVDNQAVGLTDILLVGTGIAHVGAFQFTDNLYQMVFVDNVRSDNQLHLWMLVKVFNKQILVRLPGASCHESHRVVLEKLHQRQMFGLLTNLQHTVKTGIPHHRDTLIPIFAR